MESESDFLCSYLHSPDQYRKHRCHLAKSSCGPDHPLLPASLATGTRYRSQSMMATRFCITNVWFVCARTRVLSACFCFVCTYTCTVSMFLLCMYVHVYCQHVSALFARTRVLSACFCFVCTYTCTVSMFLLCMYVHVYCQHVSALYARTRVLSACFCFVCTYTCTVSMFLLCMYVHVYCQHVSALYARTRVLSACFCFVCTYTCTMCLLMKCVCSCVFVCRWSSGLAYACIPTYLHTMFTYSFIRPPAGSPCRTEPGRVRVRRPYWWNSIV